MKNIDNKKTGRRRQLTFKYMLAIVLLFFMALLSLLVLYNVIKQQEGYAELINISGRQRMLSQRTALLALKIFAHPDQKEIGSLKAALISSLDLMEKSHHMLISGQFDNNRFVKLTEAINSMHFKEPLQVNKKVVRHIGKLRTLLQTSTPQWDREELHILLYHARTDLLDALDKVVKQFEKENKSHIVLLKQSALFIFFATICLLLLIVLFIFRPLTDAVVKNETMLRSILDNIPVLMDIVSPTGTILYQSKFLTDSIGKSSIGKKCFEVYRDNHQQCTDCPLHKGIMENAIYTIEVDCCLGGKMLQVAHLEIIFNGKPALLEVFHDMSQQKQTEKFLLLAKKEAEHASSLKSEFLANMSHELRTPLNAIIGFSEILSQKTFGELNARQEKYANNILTSGQHLLSLINDILDISKIEAGKMELEPSMVNRKELLTGSLILVREKAMKKDIDLELQIETPVEKLNILADERKLKQIIFNLLSNAAKFTREKGSVSLRARIEDCRGVEISVADTGIGIAPKDQERMFGKFEQIESSYARKQEGTGLGLALTKKLVELHKGRIWVASRGRDKGSTFGFIIPFEIKKKMKEPEMAGEK